MITFILNDTLVNIERHSATTLLDYIRYESDLKGTKIGCREGDCGACVVMEGKIVNGILSYQTITSCLTPIGNVHGKHIVTVEGINMPKLSPVQQSLVENNGTQCGFCTPGFVISLSCFLLSPHQLSYDDAIASIDGNICRCTGYKSIQRTAEEMVSLKQQIDPSDSVQWLTKKDYLPAYFNSIEARLKKIEIPPDIESGEYIIGGGTDLMVQQPDELLDEHISLLYDREDLKGIELINGYFHIGAGTVASELMNSKELLSYIPNLHSFFKLVSSTPIRNMGTVGGNIVNASPIGDLSVLFLALNADVCLRNGSQNERTLPLNEFFTGYKKLNKDDDEYIYSIRFAGPDQGFRVNFEKVSKRQFLDIASVNTAIAFRLLNDTISEVHLSAGGVSPIPIYLKKTSAFLTDKRISADILFKATQILQEEISPISDIRGSSSYKRLLLRQLFYAHFAELVPELVQSDHILETLLNE